METFRARNNLIFRFKFNISENRTEVQERATSPRILHGSPLGKTAASGCKPDTNLQNWKFKLKIDKCNNRQNKYQTKNNRENKFE